MCILGWFRYSLLEEPVNRHFDVNIPLGGVCGEHVKKFQNVHLIQLGIG